MHGTFHNSRTMRAERRETTPWFTTNSQYGRQVQQNIERRLLIKKELNSTRHQDLSITHDNDNDDKQTCSGKSRSSLSSRPLMSAQLTPSKSRGSPARLKTKERERYQECSALHLSLPAGWGQRLPPLENPSTSTNYTFRMESDFDVKRRSLEQSYYKRRNPPSGLGKRYMLSECPRLWSNMGKLDRERSPTPSVNILTIEHESVPDNENDGDADEEKTPVENDGQELRSQ